MVENPRAYRTYFSPGYDISRSSDKDPLIEHLHSAARHVTADLE